MVTSNKGGQDDDDVVITGTDFTAVQVVASIAADVANVSVGQAVTLDGTNSTGTINSFAWTQTGGAPVASSLLAHSPSPSRPRSPARTASSLTVHWSRRWQHVVGQHRLQRRRLSSSLGRTPDPIS